MNLQKRIRAGRACNYLDIADDERGHYRGCGPALIASESGLITAILYVAETITTAEVDRGDTSRVFAELILPWLAAQDGSEIWMGKMSCYQICEPQLFISGQAARLSKWIIDEYQ